MNVSQFKSGLGDPASKIKDRETCLSRHTLSRNSCKYYKLLNHDCPPHPHLIDVPPCQKIGILISFEFKKAPVKKKHPYTVYFASELSPSSSPACGWPSY